MLSRMIIRKEVQMTHQMTVSCHAATPFGVAKWLVDNALQKLLLEHHHVSQPQEVVVRPDFNVTLVKDEASDILLHRFHIGR